MVRKSYTPEQIINKLREAEILLNQGTALYVVQPGHIKRLIITGMKYRMAIAIKGVTSNMPSLGITRLSGAKTGSVASSSKRISRL